MADGGDRLAARNHDAGPSERLDLQSQNGVQPGLEIQGASATHVPGGSLMRNEDRGPAPKRRRVTFSDMNDVREIPRERTSWEQTPPEQPAEQGVPQEQPEHLSRRKSMRFPTNPYSAVRSLRDYVKPPGRVDIARRKRASTTASDGTGPRVHHRARNAPASGLDSRTRLISISRTPRPIDHTEINRARRSSIVVREEEQAATVSRISERAKNDTPRLFGDHTQNPAEESSMQDPVKRSGSVIKSLARSMSRLGLSGRSHGRGDRAVPAMGPAAAPELRYKQGDFVVSSMDGEFGPPRLDFRGYGPGW
ncbi:hypothetical protein EJ03DRAFT_355762 [Teratosphaeria nubilosa]|uniref:Uncharacterized protein n=1 Tax=Teratosphaeria nubilosa TaxID=161662 RepID=A0A6G1KV00_9PEZI|nr:hypothetical protein EJ03DRAFT_355762 [Teratosphaeria nubilosa]